MMFVTKLVAALSFLCLETTGEKFQLKLEPAPDFHLATGCCADEPIFYVRVADSTTVCENQTFPVARRSRDCLWRKLFLESWSLRWNRNHVSITRGRGDYHSIGRKQTCRISVSSQSRLRFCLPEEYTGLDGSNVIKSFIGSDVDSLETLWNPDQSGVELAACELFVTFQIGGDDDTRSFTAQGSKMIWSFEYDPSLFEDSTLEYSYGTRGYTWIRTPFDNALVDAPPPSLPPTSSPLLLLQQVEDALIVLLLLFS